MSKSLDAEVSPDVADQLGQVNLCGGCGRSECQCRGIFPAAPTHVDVKVPVNTKGLATLVFSLSLPRGVGASDERDPSDELIPAISEAVAKLGYVPVKRVALIYPSLGVNNG
jgi:hypothetical protein